MTHLLGPLTVNNNNNTIGIGGGVSLWADRPRGRAEMSLKSLENSLSSRRLRDNSPTGTTGTTGANHARVADDANGNVNQQWRSSLARAAAVPPPLRLRAHNATVNSNTNGDSVTGTRGEPALGVSAEPGDRSVPYPTPSPSPEPMLWSPFTPDACPCCRSLQHGAGPKGAPVWHRSPSHAAPVAELITRPVSVPSRASGATPGPVVSPSSRAGPAWSSPRRSPGRQANVADSSMLSILLLFHNASGASVVAIDNKIEQAMDLVKSHLMFAVREEVEVLKDQIKELMERNSHLERENSALKGLASPEQLRDIQAQLSGRQQRAIGAAPASLTP